MLATRRRYGVTAGLVLLLLVATPAAAQQASGLIKPGAPPALEVLYTGDVIGYLDPCG